MNLKTAAARLSIHYQTAYKLVRSGSLAAVKIGGTYEISEAALERYRAEREALRNAAGTVRDPAVASVVRDRDNAIAEVRAVADSSTTTARAVIETIAWVAAESVGDMCIVRARAGEQLQAVSFHDTDPKRRAALASVVHDHGFGEDGPNGVYSQVRSDQRSLLVPHVPQDRLHASVDPQHRQFLDVLGIHSLIVAPVVVDDEVEAVIVLNRATPGAPYTHDDVSFVEAMAAALQLALLRARAYCAGWQRRRELVRTMKNAAARGDRVEADEVLHEAGFAELVYDLDDRVLLNQAARRLTNGNASLLIEGWACANLDYVDQEQDVPLPDGGTRRVIVHRGLVRDETAQPRALVVVAQPVPCAPCTSWHSSTT
jgi:excisionase family DNA binding protein